MQTQPALRLSPTTINFLFFLSCRISGRFKENAKRKKKRPKLIKVTIGHLKSITLSSIKSIHSTLPASSFLYCPCPFCGSCFPLLLAPLWNRLTFCILLGNGAAESCHCVGMVAFLLQTYGLGSAALRSES